MKVFIIDVTGRVVNYDLYLLDALNNILGNNDVVAFVADCPKGKSHKSVKRLTSFVPKRLKTSESIIKRGLKVFEAVFNYLYLILKVAIAKPDILHFQWLPFLEVCSLEKTILYIIRYITPRSKVILTIHNVYPHNYDERQIKLYKDRFIRVARLIDGFIVHTNISKQEVINNFAINENRIRVIHHGLFEPDLSNICKKINGSKKFRLISYGHQDPYKGTDILIDAISLLPIEYKERISLSVVGRGQPSYTDLLKEKGKGLPIDWKLFFVDDNTLYQEISDSDAIILPYRNISQSGVLLLALYFDKPVICSDLPAFVETLEGYPRELFFKTEDPESLKTTIIQLMDSGVNENKLHRILSVLREKYSWEEAARLTIIAYKDNFLWH